MDGGQAGGSRKSLPLVRGAEDQGERRESG